MGVVPMARETQQYGEFRIDGTGGPGKAAASSIRDGRRGWLEADAKRAAWFAYAALFGSLRAVGRSSSDRSTYGMEASDPAGAVAASRRARRASPWPARAMRITVTPTPNSVPQTIVSRPTISQEFSPGT